MVAENKGIVDTDDNWGMRHYSVCSSHNNYFQKVNKQVLGIFT